MGSHLVTCLLIYVNTELLWRKKKLLGNPFRDQLKNRGSKYLAGLVGKYSLVEVNAINGDRINPDCVCCVTHSLTDH